MAKNKNTSGNSNFWYSVIGVLGAAALSATIGYFSRKKSAKEVSKLNAEEGILREQQIDLTRQRNIARFSRFGSAGGDADYINSSANLDIDILRAQISSAEYAIQQSAGLGFLNFSADFLNKASSIGSSVFGGTSNFVGSVKQAVGSWDKSGVSAIAAESNAAAKNVSFRSGSSYLQDALNLNYSSINNSMFFLSNLNLSSQGAEIGNIFGTFFDFNNFDNFIDRIV